MKPTKHPGQAAETGSPGQTKSHTDRDSVDLDSLLSAYLEGDLDASQWQHLTIRKDDADFQQQWQEGMRTHASLMVAMEPEPGQNNVIPINSRYRPLRLLGKVALVAAAVVVGILVIQELTDSPLTETEPSQTAQQAPQHAIIIGSESGDTQHLTEGKLLTTESIQMNRGWLSIQTLRGVTMTLRAPFSANIVSVDKVELMRGTARVYVPNGAEGFQLTTPNMEITRPGREFAVQVDQDGAGRMRVFEGEADISLINPAGQSISQKRVAAKHSAGTNSEYTDLVAIDENDQDYQEIIIPPRSNLALEKLYPLAVKDLDPVGYWRFESVHNAKVPNEVEGGISLRTIGSAKIVTETNDNHSGELTNYHETELFSLNGFDHRKLRDSFTFSLYFQMQWLQNYALISASHYGKNTQGYAFLMQAYADFDKSGFYGTGPHTVLRDPPAWAGGIELYGNQPLKPLHWHHMAATKDGGKLTIYLDGKKVGSQNVGKAVMDFRTIFVGRMTSNPELSRTDARGLVGHIDELAIFDRALTADEIRTLASGKQAPR